jgi:hypothetical protein
VRPAFPAPSDFLGERLIAQLGRIAPRDREVAYLDVIARSEADEAIQSSSRGEMDCFAEPVIGRRFAPTRWLAMTGGVAV